MKNRRVSCAHCGEYVPLSGYFDDCIVCGDKAALTDAEWERILEDIRQGERDLAEGRYFTLEETLSRFA